MIPKDKGSKWYITVRKLLVLTFSCWWCSLPRGGWRGTPPRPWTLAAEADQGRARGPWGSRRRGQPPTVAARPGRQTGDTRRCVWASGGAPGGRGQGSALEGAAGGRGSCRGRRSPLLTSRPGTGAGEGWCEPLCGRLLRRLWREQPLPYTRARSTNNPEKHDLITINYQRGGNKDVLAKTCSTSSLTIKGCVRLSVSLWVRWFHHF